MNGPLPVVQDKEWSVELLRGCAAVMVMFAHYWPIMKVEQGMLALMFTGVDLFFVLSGFVFAPYLLGRPLPLLPHLIRRLFRIYPLYAVSLLVYAGLRTYQGLGTDHLLVHFLFLHTMESPQIAFYFNPAYWSLPPEVEFYLALPLLAAVIRTPGALLVAFGLALACHLGLAYGSPEQAEVFNTASLLNVHLPGLLVEFLLGGLAWHVVSQGPSAAARLALLLAGCAGWLALAWSFHALSSAGGNRAVQANDLLRGNVGLLAAMAFALAVAAVVGWVRQPPAWLGRLALRAGTLSYGTYLFHNALPTLLAPLQGHLPPWAFALLCMAATLSVAGILCVTVEYPLRRVGRMLSARVR